VSRKLAKAWESLAAEQKEAAEVLRDKDLHRASVGRAYYAAYSGVTSALIGSGMKEFGRHQNPAHSDLPNLVTNNLGSITKDDRRELASALRRLKGRRVDSDYRPTVGVSDEESRESLRDLASVRVVLERTGAR
jgi:uncharacterized protein (UPF0332 family)